MNNKNETNRVNPNAWLVRLGEEVRLNGYVLKAEGGRRKAESRRMKLDRSCVVCMRATRLFGKRKAEERKLNGELGEFIERG